MQAITTELQTAENKRKAQVEIKHKAQKLIQQGFSASVSDFQSWLYLPKLIDCDQSEWLQCCSKGYLAVGNGVFRDAIAQDQQAIIK